MKDLREWMSRVEELGELQVLRGVPRELEMGTIAEIVARQKDKPAVLFDDIPGFPAGRRVLINPIGSRNRLALSLGLPPQLSPMEMVHEWRRRIKEMQFLPPRFVDGGPVMENTAFGEEVDVLQFPAPLWHEKDGGDYIGTGDMVITRGPDGNWVNVGTYRVMVQDRNHLGIMITPTHHGRWQMDEWFAQGKPAPVAIVVGMDPLFFLVGTSDVPMGLSEYDYAGAIRGEPVEVIRGAVTGLPIPAHAEIALEGFVDPEDLRMEGPFGEYPGYYGIGRPLPTVRVEGLYYRKDPIILGSPPVKPPEAMELYRNILRISQMWNALEEAGIPDITGLWGVVPPAFFTAISIRQRYPGHAKQAGRMVAQYRVGATINHFTVVVDEDIDVTDTDEVLWAMCTRVDPERDIEVLPGSTSSPLDPIIHPEKRTFPVAAQVVIDATRPYEWRERFPEVVASSPQLKQQVLSRWAEALKGII